MTKPFPTRLRLTNRAIDEICALPVGKRARRYWDTIVPNMLVQFSSTGTPSFVLRYTKLDGSDGDFAIGLVSRVAIESARAVAKAAMNDLEAHGIDPVEARRQARAEARAPKLSTFADLAEAYMESRAALRPGQAQLDEVFFLRRYVLPEFGPRKFDKITVQCVMDLVTAIKMEVGDRKRRKGADGKCTSNACHRAIKRLYKWACNKELATKNPGDFKCLFPIKRPKRRGRLDAHRFDLFWTETTKRFDYTRRSKAGALAILLYMTTLQRPIDVARAMREHIDLEKRMWVIPEWYTKTGYTYYIPLSEPAVRLFRIAMRISEGDFLFPSNRKNGPHLDEHSLTTGWIGARNRLLKSGALDDVDVELYDARRFGRTQIRKKLGFSNEVAEAVINHVGEQNSMSQLYDVDELLPEMTEAHDKWCVEIDAMTDGGLSKIIDFLEDATK